MASAATQNIGGVDIEVRAGYDKFDRGMVRVEQRARTAGGVMVREFDKADRSAGRLEATLKRTASSIALFGGGFAAAGLLKGIIDAADTMTLLRGRIANVITEGETLNGVMRDLYTASQQNRASIDGTAQLYLRLRNTMKELNHEAALAITSTFSKTLILSGASASEAASSMLQFAQAMGSGRLQGDELRSLLENNSRFAKLLSTQLGVNVGQLKALGEAGALSGDLVAKALEKGGAAVDAEFANIPLTVGQAFQQLQNGLLNYISQVDQSFGVTERIAQGIAALTDNLETLGDALITIGAALGTGAALYGITLLGKQAQVFAVSVTAAMAALGDRTPSGRIKAELDAITAKLTANRVALTMATERVAALRAEYDRLAASGASKPILAKAMRELDAAGRTQEQLIAKQSQLSTSLGRTSAAFAQSANGIKGAARSVASVMGNVAMSITNFFGGPLGLAILTISAAAAVMTSTALEAERAARSVQGGLELVASMNLEVSAAAAKAAGKTDELTTAMENQKKAVDALNASKRNQLRVDLEQAVVDARRTRENALNRVKELEGLNNLPFTAQSIKDFRQPYIDKAREEAGRMGDLLPILETGLQAVKDGFTGIGEEAPKNLSKAEEAVRKFKEGIAALRASTITDDKFKSSGVKNQLEQLAEIDLASARAQFDSVKDLLLPADVQAIEKSFIRISRASLELKTSLNSFATDAERFKKSIKDIAAADPLEGDKSRAAVQAIVDYGRELKNLPAAMKAIEGIKFLNPEDAQLARNELSKLALESGRAFGTEAQQAQQKFALTLREINEAEAALIATGQNFNPDRFNVARALATQELAEATRNFPIVTEQMDDLAEIVRDMMTPLERVNEELAELANLRAGEVEGSAATQALDRKRIDLLDDEAKAAGYAGDALRTLMALRASAGMTDAEVRAARDRIVNAADEGRKGMRWQELSENQKTEAASKLFADTFTEALTEGIRSGNFGDALRDVIAQKAAEGLADGIATAGKFLGDSLFGEKGLAWTALGSLFGTGLPARAHGGKVKAGQPYMTGEAGREIFIPGADGYIAPNSALKGTGQAWAKQGAKMIGTIRGGDLIVQGDVGTHELLRRMQMMQEAENRTLPKRVRNEFREIRRRS